MNADIRQTVVEKPTPAFLVAINALSAIFAHCLFMTIVFLGFKAVWDMPKLSDENLYEVLTSALVFACVLSSIIITVGAYALDRLCFDKNTGLRSVRILQALYFSPIGIISVCGLKTLEAGRLASTFILLVAVGLLAILGSERQIGNKHPASFLFLIMLQVILQEWILFPLGLVAVDYFLARLSS